MSKAKHSVSEGVRAAIGKVETLVKENRISASELVEYAEADYPLFSFLHISDYSWDRCGDLEIFPHFLMRLKKLSQLGWKRIGISDRHSFGSEKIPVSQLTQSARNSLPSFVTDDMKLEVFRASGNNLPFLGLRKGRVFMILLIETKFGEVYPHG